MATTTSLVLIQRLSEAIGDYLSLTASGGTTTTVVDTDLDNLTEDNGGVQGYVKIVTDAGGSGAAPEGEIRRIKNGTSGYTASSTTITVNFAFTASPASGDTYELHRFDPVVKRNAINSAIRSLYPSRDTRGRIQRGLYLPLLDESIFVDDRLSNSGFETFSGGFTGWTAVGSPTVAEESTVVFHGTKSAKVTSAGGAAGQLTQTPDVNVQGRAGQTATFKRWVWASVASEVRVRIDWDGGSTFANSEYHTGDSSWRLLSVSGTIPTNATQVKVICEVIQGGKVGYFDGPGGLIVGPKYKYTLPSSFVQGPHSVSMQHNENNVEGPYYPIPEGGVPISGRILRLEGMGRLTEPASDSATTEVDGARADLIVAEAARRMFSGMARGDSNNLIHSPDFWADEVFQKRASPGIAMPVMSAETRRNNWNVLEDSDGKYLVFTNVREGVVGYR